MTPQPLPILDAAFLETLQTAIWIFDIDSGRIVWANAAGLKTLQSPSLEELRGRDMQARVSPGVVDRVEQYRRDFRDHDAVFNEQWTIYPRGVPTTLDIFLRGYRFADGRIGMLCEARDGLEETPERLRSVDALRHTSVMITLYDDDGAALFRNSAARAAAPSATARLRDRFAAPAEHDLLLADLSATRSSQRSTRIHTAAGVRWHEVTASCAIDPSTGAHAILVSEIDVTKLKQAEERATFLAQRDVLTGVFNRHYLDERAALLLREEPDPAGDPIHGLIVIDIDDFKAVNDAHGHAFGDQLLASLAETLRRFVRDRGFVVRLGGDEFLLFIEDAESAVEFKRLCASLIASASGALPVGDADVEIGFSLGASLYPQHGRRLSDLLKNADFALYDAKRSGKKRRRLYSPELRAARDARVALEKDLVRALENDEFEIVFQPRVSVESDRVVGAEALLRWRREDGAYMSPSAFVPVCEETGLIVPIGAWVLEAAAREQRRLADQGHDLTISVNVSPRQLATPGLAETLAALTETNAWAPDRIELEITESMIVQDDQANIDILERIRALGFKLAIDDFGTGYSNLVYLQSFPVTSMKIDRSFIATIGEPRSVAGLVLSFCELLDIKAVAEGVERPQQLNWLRTQRCAEYQGFLFSRPLTIDAFADRVMAQNNRPPLGAPRTAQIRAAS